jgi:UDPglucose 6-dehydrogenase
MRVCKIGTGYVVVETGACLGQIESGNLAKVLVLDRVAENQSRLSLVSAGNHRQSRRLDVQFDVVSSPDFLRAGSAISDLSDPTIDCCAQTQDLHQSSEVLPTVQMAIFTADLGSVQMIENIAFFAMTINSIDKIANIYKQVDADVTQVSERIGLASKMGRKLLNARISGVSFCLPQYLAALIHILDYQHLLTLICCLDHDRWSQLPIHSKNHRNGLGFKLVDLVWQ